MITLTGEDILAAAAYAAQHPEAYDQAMWCGTACCVLGHARRMAGSEQVQGGPRPGEISMATPRERALARMLFWRHADTAQLMPHIEEDGVCRVPDGGVGAFGGGAVIRMDTEIDADAVIRVGTVICEGVVVGAEAVIGARAVIGEGVVIRAGAEIGAGEVVELY